MAGISSKALNGAAENIKKFNDGTELESKEFSDGSGLELYSTEFRSYDPQIGRFHQVDPLAEFSFNWSGYSFVQNNPILFNDPLGLDTLRRNADGSLPTQRPDGSNLQDIDVVLGSNGAVENYYNGQSWQAPKDLDNITVTGKKKDPEKKDDPASKTPWMDQAQSEVGTTEDKKPGRNNPEIVKYHRTTLYNSPYDATPWCASFVNWCFLQSNIPSLNSAGAFDYLKFGYKLDKPAYGAVAVMNYSHVGFVAGRNSDGRIVILGGNQGDAVNYSPNSPADVLQYRYPRDFKPNYSLPAFKLRGRSLTGGTSR
jgi:uncharacterized protein (TIGR02594 family)